MSEGGCVSEGVGVGVGVGEGDSGCESDGGSVGDSECNVWRDFIFFFPMI